MNKLLVTLNNTLKLNSKLFLNCFENITENESKQRINQNTNSFLFIAIHIVDARYYLLNFLSCNLQSPFEKLLKNINHIDEIKHYPPLSDILTAWETVSVELLNKFKELNDDDLSVKSSASFPLDDKTILSGITFFVQHESYHVGQLGFLRKCLGKGSMSYK